MRRGFKEIMQGNFPGLKVNTNGQIERNAKQDEYQIPTASHAMNIHNFLDKNKIQKNVQRGKGAITFKRMRVSLGSHFSLESTECLKTMEGKFENL